MSYPPAGNPGNLVLMDRLGRFCSEGGKQPVLKVEATGGTVGYALIKVDMNHYDMNHVQIGNIPGANASDTPYVLAIETYVPCTATASMTLRFKGAIKYTQ